MSEGRSSSQGSLEMGDTEKECSSRPDLCFRDQQMQQAMLNTFNQMRKDKHFCDVTLQLGPFEFPAHRLVLSSASAFLLELFTAKEERPPTMREVENGTGIVYSLSEANVDKEALEALVDYAYTAKLEISSDLVERVYSASLLLRMDRASEACAAHLRSILAMDTCLSVRAIAATAPAECSHELLKQDLDAFIVNNFDQLLHTRQLLQLTRINVEIVHLSAYEKDLVRVDALANLVLEALVNNGYFEDEKQENELMLYLGNDHTLKDCNEIEDGSARDSERIREYKQRHRKKSKSRKVTPTSSRPARSREQLYSRLIEQDSPLIDCGSSSKSAELIATQIKEQRIVSLVSLKPGTLAILSIVQRVDTESGSEQTESLEDTESVHDICSRLTSEERELYTSLAVMDEPRCGMGVCALEDKLVVCGGFNRAQCLDSVTMFDVNSNAWHALPSMLSRRARFDTTVVQNTLFAVAGSNGHFDESSVECIDLNLQNNWKSLNSLPLPVSGIGLATLDNTVYCVGGTYGQSGNRHCYSLDAMDARWTGMASLNQGRTQAGVTAFRERIWAVGGSDGWNPLASVEIYDPRADTWSLGPPIGGPRRGCAIVAFGDVLYLVGGSDGTQSLCTTEVLDPRLNVWTPGPTMTTCRANVAAAKVGDAIFAVGGFSGKTFLNSLEHLRPARDEWTAFVPTDTNINNNNNNNNNDDKNNDNDEDDKEDDVEKTGLVVDGELKRFHVRRAQQLMPSMEANQSIQ